MDEEGAGRGGYTLDDFRVQRQRCREEGRAREARLRGGRGAAVAARAPVESKQGKQDYATIRGWGVVSGLGPDEAADLAASLAGPHFYEVSVLGDTVRTAISYGPVLGAWPADLRRLLVKAAVKVQPSALVSVEGVCREVISRREDYDAQR
jgi:hypothetical protein